MVIAGHPYAGVEVATINAVTPDVPSLARCCSLRLLQCLQALASANTSTWASSTTLPLASTVSRSSPCDVPLIRLREGKISRPCSLEAKPSSQTWEMHLLV